MCSFLAAQEVAIGFRSASNLLNVFSISCIRLWCCFGMLCLQFGHDFEGTLGNMGGYIGCHGCVCLSAKIID